MEYRAPKYIPAWSEQKQNRRPLDTSGDVSRPAEAFPDLGEPDSRLTPADFDLPGAPAYDPVNGAYRAGNAGLPRHSREAQVIRGIPQHLQTLGTQAVRGAMSGQQ